MTSSGARETLASVGHTRGRVMRSSRFALVVACTALVVGCGGPGAGAPEDASIEDFCAAKSWMVAEGTDRFFAEGLPSDGELARLANDWSAELVRVGTPDNMSLDAREGFEKLVARLEDLEAGDVEDRGFNWQDGDWENEAETSFARYVTNTCP